MGQTEILVFLNRQVFFLPLLVLSSCYVLFSHLLLVTSFKNFFCIRVARSLCSAHHSVEADCRRRAVF